VCLRVCGKLEMKERRLPFLVKESEMRTERTRAPVENPANRGPL
jgi:hypothetical protein